MTDDDDRIVPFDEWLPEHRHGGCLVELTEKLAEVARAVLDTEKPGTLTLKIKVTPLARGNRRTVIVSDTVDAKVPEHDRDESMFFVGDSGALLRDDPSQGRLDLRDMPMDDAPVRDPHGDDSEDRR